jgi:hypothetical protein
MVAGPPGTGILKVKKERIGGRHGIRTHDPGVANAVLSQLS